MMHPFAPLEQAQGYQQLFEELEACWPRSPASMRFRCSPMPAAQGEYAGLLAIRGYHRARGEDHRDVCLIPSSAHGTNPASRGDGGHEGGGRDCDERGNIDVADLKAKAEAPCREPRGADGHLSLAPTACSRRASRRSARSSTQHGGQVYLDGANLNAQVGLVRPARARRRCLPSQSAQDILHPAWRRRAGHGADRRQGASGAASCRRIRWYRRQPGGGRSAASGRCRRRHGGRRRSCRSPGPISR